MRRNRDRMKGFTLFEVLVAVSIMSICSVVIMQVISLSLKNVSKSRDYSNLVLAAENEMERILLQDEITNDEEVVIERDDYKVKYRVTPLEDDVISDEESLKRNFFFNMYEVTLTVYDKNPQSKREFTLSGLKYGKRIVEEKS